MESPSEEREEIKGKEKELSKERATRAEKKGTVHASVRKEDRREETKEGNMEDIKEERNRMEEHGITKEEAKETNREAKQKDSKARATYAASSDTAQPTAGPQEKAKVAKAEHTQ